MEEISELSNIHIINTGHILEYIYSRNLISEYSGLNAFLVNLGWLKNWQKNINDMGFDKETARMFFHDSFKRIVYIDSCSDINAEVLLDDFFRVHRYAIYYKKVDLDINSPIFKSLDSEYQAK